MRAALRGLTTRGRSLLAAGAALALCSSVLGERDLLRVAIFLLTLPLAAVAVVTRTRYRLSCTRVLAPPRVEAGRSTTVRLRLDNVSRLPSGVLLMEDALPYVLGGRPRFVLDRVEPGGVREVTYPVRSEVRGRFRLGPLSVRLADPFGLCELDRAFAATDELVVTPALFALPGVRLGGDRSGGGDGGSRSVAVSGSDDAGTREYRHGDDLRKVHWRSTARVGEMMVRREEQPFQSRATLLLDGRAVAHRGEGPGSSYEWAVGALASIGVHLLGSGFTVRLLDERGRGLLPPGVPTTPASLLDAAASVQATATATLELEGLRRAGVDGVLVAVLGLLCPDDAERLARLRVGASSCVAVLVDSTTWTNDPRRRPARRPETYDACAATLLAAGWRVLRVSHGTTLASVWPQAGGRGAPTWSGVPA